MRRTLVLALAATALAAPLPLVLAAPASAEVTVCTHRVSLPHDLNFLHRCVTVEDQIG